MALEEVQNRENQSFSPSIDAYYWTKTPFGNSVSFNLVGSLIGVQATTDLRDRDAGRAKSVDYRTDLNNSKRTLIGEIAYNFPIGMFFFDCGYKATYSMLKYHYEQAGKPLSYQSELFTQYAYVQPAALFGRWLLCPSIGYYHQYSTASSSPVHQHSFVPSVLIGYIMNTHHVLALRYQLKTVQPQLNDLRKSRMQSHRHFFSTGNPDLRTAYAHDVKLSYRWNNEYLNINSALGGIYTRHPVMHTYRVRGAFLELYPRNALWSAKGYASLFTSVKPFGNRWLKLGARIKPVYSKIQEQRDRTFQLFDWDNEFTCESEWKGWNLAWQYRPGGHYALQGISRYALESHNQLALAYSLKGWRFSAAIMWIGAPSFYGREIDTQMGMRQISKSYIYDNRNMVTLGIAYHFETKVYEGNKRTLHNADQSAPNR